MDRKNEWQATPVPLGIRHKTALPCLFELADEYSALNYKNNDLL
jgi:hypothetical protein